MGSLNAVRWSPVPLPPGAHERDISAFPVDTTRNAVNQGGVGGFPNGANWRQNAVAMPFTLQPGPVYRADSVALRASQPYRATAGWNTIVSVYSPLSPYLLAGVPRSGGAPTAAALQQRVLALLAMRQRTAATRGKRKN